LYAQAYTSEHLRSIRSSLSKTVLEKSGVRYCGSADVPSPDPNASHILRITSTAGELRKVPQGTVVFYRTSLELVEYPSLEVVWKGSSGFGVGPAAFRTRSTEQSVYELAHMYFGALDPLAKAGLISPPDGKVWLP